VIDSGTKLDHPDLAPNVWTNFNEVPGNGVDDDHNGYVDDVHGVDLTSDRAGQDLHDGVGHGTHVAGIVAAAANRRGVVGVAFRAKIMTVKVIDDAGRGTTAGVAEGVRYAAANGARVINMSLQGDDPDPRLKEAIDAAAAANVLVVCSAGNSARNIDAKPSFPASVPAPNLIGVAATAPAVGRDLDVNSNYRRLSVQLAAPGEQILSSAKTGDYQYKSGTSMAAPQVAGVAALIGQPAPAARAAPADRGARCRRQAGRARDAPDRDRPARQARRLGRAPDRHERSAGVDRLSVALVAILLATPAPAGARTITMSGANAALPVAGDLAYYYRHDVRDPPRFSLVGGGTESGIADVARRIVDVGLVSRALGPGDPDGLVMTPFALSGVCLVTNRANPLPGLSRAQLQDLVAARATSWSQIPGSTRTDAIQPVALDLTAGTRSVFLSVFVDLGTPLAYAPRTFATVAQARDFIESAPAAWGYVDSGFTAGLHVVPYEGVNCTRATIASGAYVARRPLAFVTRGRPLPPLGGDQPARPPRDLPPLRPAVATYASGMVEVNVTLEESGRAYIDLAAGSGGEIRNSVALDELEDAERIPALAALVLHFDFYGRLAGIEVTDAAASALPPALLDAASAG
jgi:ABC-type phosphate transport system substrate-binding protein